MKKYIASLIIMAGLSGCAFASVIGSTLDDVAADVSAGTQRYFLSTITAGYTDRAQAGNSIDRTGFVRVPLASARGFFLDSSFTLDSGGLQQYDLIFPVKRFDIADIEANVFRNMQYDQTGFGIKATIKIR